LISPKQKAKSRKLTACSLPKIIEERVYSLLTTNNTYLKGVDDNFSKVNATEKTFNGQWLKPIPIK
jgi:hypothetical protein